MGDMYNFRNFNANLETFNVDSEVKVNVTGVKTLMFLEKSCPRACVCQISKVYLNWYRRYETFLETYADLETLT